MRILHVGKFYPPFWGGMETFLASLCCVQQQQGLEARVLVHGDPHLTAPPCPDGSSIAVRRVRPWGRLLFTPVAPGFRRQLRQEIGSLSPQVLHLHLPNPSAFWVMSLPEAREVPWVVHWHADVVTPEIDWKVRVAYAAYRPPEQALLKRCSRIIVTSPPYLEASRALATWRKKTVTIPLGLDPSWLKRSAPPTTPWRPAGLRILAIGRLAYYKGFEFLLKAMAQQPALQLILVGEGEKRTDLNTLRRKLDLESRVQLCGSLNQDELAGLMASCDCLCLPSIDRAEAFGMVLLEAMAAGKPVVVSDVPGSGMGWVMEDEVTGIKVPPADSVALAAAFRKLAAAPGDCRRMGEQARDRFDRLFHIDKVAARITDLYEEVLSA